VMELALQSCAQSSSVSASTSSMVSPGATRTYTCALDILSTWNLPRRAAPRAGASPVISWRYEYVRASPSHVSRWRPPGSEQVLMVRRTFDVCVHIPATQSVGRYRPG